MVSKGFPILKPLASFITDEDAHAVLSTNIFFTIGKNKEDIRDRGIYHNILGAVEQPRFHHPYAQR